MLIQKQFNKNSFLKLKYRNNQIVDNQSMFFLMILEKVKEMKKKKLSQGSVTVL